MAPRLIWGFLHDNGQTASNPLELIELTKKYTRRGADEYVLAITINLQKSGRYNTACGCCAGFVGAGVALSLHGLVTTIGSFVLSRCRKLAEERDDK